MGRPKGSKNKPRLQLVSQISEHGKKSTPAQRMQAMKLQVALCVCDGMADESIAAVLEMPPDKLRAVFSRELQHGREIVRAEELMRLSAGSSEGNVTASKALLGTDNQQSKRARDARTESGDKITRMALRVLQGGSA
jgi:hypothetical protein